MADGLPQTRAPRPRPIWVPRHALPAAPAVGATLALHVLAAVALVALPPSGQQAARPVAAMGLHDLSRVTLVSPAASAGASPSAPAAAPFEAPPRRTSAPRQHRSHAPLSPGPDSAPLAAGHAASTAEPALGVPALPLAPPTAAQLPRPLPPEAHALAAVTAGEGDCAAGGCGARPGPGAAAKSGLGVTAGAGIPSATTRGTVATFGMVPFDRLTRRPRRRHDCVARYPDAARRQGLVGTVHLDVEVRADGSVGAVRVVDGPDPTLNDAAMAALLACVFTPAELQGEPVATQIFYTYTFSLQD